MRRLPIGRRLAYDLVALGEVDLEEFGARALRLDVRPDPRRAARVLQCASRMTECGLTRWVTPGRLGVVDADGLRRVIQVGLDAFTAETGPAAPPGARGKGPPGRETAG